MNFVMNMFQIKYADLSRIKLEKHPTKIWVTRRIKLINVDWSQSSENSSKDQVSSWLNMTLVKALINNSSNQRIKIRRFWHKKEFLVKNSTISNLSSIIDSTLHTESH